MRQHARFYVRQSRYVRQILMFVQQRLGPIRDLVVIQGMLRRIQAPKMIQE